MAHGACGGSGAPGVEGPCPQLGSRHGAYTGPEPRFSGAAYRRAGRQAEWRPQGGGVSEPCQPSLGTCALSPLAPSMPPMPPAGALEIGQALPVHAGRYTCTARNPAGVAHKHVVLAVRGKGPPQRGES